MNPETNPEKIASELRLKSESFFSLTIVERRGKAKEFLQWIENNITNEVLNFTVERNFQDKLEIAANKAFNTPQILLDNQRGDDQLPNDYIFPVDEGYTVVAINEKGIPIGYIYNPILKMGEFNTTAVAYQKAILLKIIEDEGRANGLAGKLNMEFAKSLGYRRHWGSALRSVNIQGHGRVYVGASGVGQNQDYNQRLLDGAIPSDFTNAGLFDAYFSTITAEMLETPDIPLHPHLEHDLFTDTLDRN